MSSKILLQMLRSGDSKQDSGTVHLWAAASTELETLTTVLQCFSDTQHHVLTTYEGIDVFAIGVFAARQYIRNRQPGELELPSLVRRCLMLLGVIANRFSGIRALQDALEVFVDILSHDGIDIEADMLRLGNESCKPGTCVPRGIFDQMKAAIVRNHELHAVDNWANGPQSMAM